MIIKTATTSMSPKVYTTIPTITQLTNHQINTIKEDKNLLALKIRKDRITLNTTIQIIIYSSPATTTNNTIKTTYKALTSQTIPSNLETASRNHATTQSIMMKDNIKIIIIPMMIQLIQIKLASQILTVRPP